MAQRWVDITTINNNTPFSAVRWLETLNILDDSGWLEFSEVSGLTVDGRGWYENAGPSWGYASTHRNNSGVYSYTCTFLNEYRTENDVTVDASNSTAGTAVHDVGRSDPNFYDRTVTINGQTYYEVDFSTWQGYTPLYYPYSGTAVSAGEVYVLVGDADIKVNPEEVTFRTDGGSSSVTVTAKDVWSASTNDAWITISTSSGQSGDTSINVSVPSYSGASARTGIVSFSCNTDVFELTVTQNPPQIDLNKDKLKFKSTGGTDTIEITSDLNWTASTVDNWLTLSPSSGTSATTAITVTAAAFVGGSSARTDVISITDGTNTETVNVKQNYKLGVDGLMIGTETVDGLFLGTEEVDAMYIGTVQIF